MIKIFISQASLLCALLFMTFTTAFAQVDPMNRSLLQLGYDQPLTGYGPQALYGYYYYNNPNFLGTNIAFRTAFAAIYQDGEIGFKELLSPTTDVGVGIYGGLWGDNYYDVQQGNYRQGESFRGSGGGSSLAIYQRLNPGMMIPINAVLRGGAKYVVYSKTDETQGNFELPPDHVVGFMRTGIRVAGREPVLYPDLGLELSVWYERQWRGNASEYGLADSSSLNSYVDLYWLYAGMNYAWTNTGHKISFATTLGGSGNVDQIGAWRLGGVLPLIAEFPLILPGYYYQELTAQRFLHLYAAYTLPLDHPHHFKFRLEAASALVDFLPGYQQPSKWQTGVGCGISYTPKSAIWQVVLRYGYGINALRDGREGAHSIGILFQYDFERRSRLKHEE